MSTDFSQPCVTISYRAMRQIHPLTLALVVLIGLTTVALSAPPSRPSPPPPLFQDKTCFTAQCEANDKAKKELDAKILETWKKDTGAGWAMYKEAKARGRITPSYVKDVLDRTSKPAEPKTKISANSLSAKPAIKTATLRDFGGDQPGPPHTAVTDELETRLRLIEERLSRLEAAELRINELTKENDALRTQIREKR